MVYDFLVHSPSRDERHLVPSGEGLVQPEDEQGN